MSTTELDPTPVAATVVAPPRGNKPIGKSPATVAWLMLVPAGSSMSSAVVVEEREPLTGLPGVPAAAPLRRRPLRVVVAEAFSAAVIVVMSVTHWK